MAKPARRKCKICKEWFHPAFSNQWWCSPEHGTKLASNDEIKNAKRRKKQQRRNDDERSRNRKIKLRFENSP
ncbi:recombination protein NinG [Escherichia coli]|uniref:recombination protein NinG n=1 Tax=Escherichia coli TaxID=562 RepID=UPI0003EE97CB|nr:recombination endonuclease [Escherichia coli SHECO003]